MRWVFNLERRATRYQPHWQQRDLDVFRLSRIWAKVARVAYGGVILGGAMIFWMSTIAVSVALLVLTAAGRSAGGSEGLTMAYLHMALAAIMAAVFTAMAIREAQSIETTGRKGEIARAAVLTRHMGLVWAWGALALAATYGTGIVTWKEWPGFLIAFAAFASVSLFIARRLDAQAVADHADERFIKMSRYLGIALFAGTIIVMLGLIIDGKMTRFLAIQRENWQDWAANNYFFFGAAALAAISAFGTFMTKPTADTAGAQ